MLQSREYWMSLRWYRRSACHLTSPLSLQSLEFRYLIFYNLILFFNYSPPFSISFQFIFGQFSWYGFAGNSVLGRLRFTFGLIETPVNNCHQIQSCFAARSCWEHLSRTFCFMKSDGRLMTWPTVLVYSPLHFSCQALHRNYHRYSCFRYRQTLSRIQRSLHPHPGSSSTCYFWITIQHQHTLLPVILLIRFVPGMRGHRATHRTLSTSTIPC